MSQWSLSQLLSSLHEDIQQRLSVVRKTFGHPGTKGDASENVWIDMLDTYLPKRYQAAKAHVEYLPFTYLYADGDDYVFMNKENYEQIHVSADVVGDLVPYLQENMEVEISLHNGNAIALEGPQRVILEVTETEPVVKGQTAANSFKSAMLSNGVRTQVPPHIATGTRVVINTADGAYVERAKE